MADLDDHSLEHGSVRERLKNLEAAKEVAANIGADYTRIKTIGYIVLSALLGLASLVGFLINVYLKTQS